MRTLIHWLWEKELRDISATHRWIVSAAAVFFVAVFSYQFVLLMHNLVYLGPGLGDTRSTRVLETLILDRLSGPNAPLAWAFGAFLLGVVLFRAWVMLWSYFGYEKTFGEKFPAHIIPLFMLVNAVGALSIPVVLCLLGGLLWAFGYDFQDGWLWMQHTVAATHNWVMTHVPTLIPLPSPLAIVAVFMVAGFAHYWLHRLGHESRALWLLFHRHHHMTPNLCQMSTAAVFFAFPLFVLFFVPYTFLFASITKLFHAQPLYIEAFVLNSLLLLPEIFGHSDVFYNWARKQRWARWGGFLFSGGVYHYLHHSAEPDDAVVKNGFFRGRHRRVNMINMGGGFLFLWDKLFGTYAPLREKRPRVGLTGCPPLHTNPVRLALSGPAQLIYEWRHNRDWRTRFRILFGPSDYTPPASRDFALRQTAPSNSAPDVTAVTAGPA